MPKANCVQHNDYSYRSSDISGLDIKYLIYMPVRHMVVKIYVPCKNFQVPSQYLYKPCKAYVYFWENKYMPRLKNHLPCRARKHKSLCALRQDLHAPSMQARLNVEPCIWSRNWMCDNFQWPSPQLISFYPTGSTSLLFMVISDSRVCFEWRQSAPRDLMGKIGLWW